MSTTTLTFGDVAENHKGMQKMGNLEKSGFTLVDLEYAKGYFESRGVTCDLVSLKEDEANLPDAHILIARKGLSVLVDVNELKKEQDSLEKDSKAFMYGRVVNKHARHNLCFSDFDQKPVYEEGKGTVINFNHLPYLSQLRKKWEEIVGKKDLQCEGNYYYNVDKTYIGFHGDTERRVVIGVRLGEPFPLHYVWYKEGKPISNVRSFILDEGDIYFMSEKATGFDWKLKKTCTLRHAAGNLKLVKKW